MYSGLATVPGMKLSSGCFVGPEPIEGVRCSSQEYCFVAPRNTRKKQFRIATSLSPAAFSHKAHGNTRRDPNDALPSTFLRNAWGALTAANARFQIKPVLT